MSINGCAHGIPWTKQCAECTASNIKPEKRHLSEEEERIAELEASVLLDQKVSCNRRAGAIVGNDAFDKLQDQKAYSSRECALPCQRVELNAKRTQGSWPRPFSAGKGEKNDQNTFGMPAYWMSAWERCSW
jgi:hypothetical protein